MMTTCAQTVPLLEEMIARQQDARRMSELFVQVDRMRSRATRDRLMFEMVCQLNTVGELRRFQNDLGVKATPHGGLARQKQQLLRDIDYVRNLRVGCERLLVILDEALARLQQQLAAAQRGAPWPRSVAGS
jgi:hypothetical protein